MKRSLLVVGLLAACSTGVPPAPSEAPPLDQTVRTRYAADTSDGGFERGALRQTITDQYDAAGNVVFSEYVGGDGGIQMRFVSTVENGERTTTEWRREDGSLALTVRYTYDEEGRLYETRQFGPDGEFRRGFRARYTERGRETGPIPEDGEAFEPDSFYRVNSRGEDVELLEFPDVDSLRTVFTYDYPERDAFGNWTVRRTFRDGTPTQIADRELTYRDEP